LNSRNKKSIEKLHFKYFKECCEVLPSGVIYDDEENPDFLIKHDSGVLGIEHTQLFKETKYPNNLKALESFRKQIVDTAKNSCEKDIPPLLVNVWFYSNGTVPKNRKQELTKISKTLTEFVKKWHKENPSKDIENFRYPSESLPISHLLIAHVWDGTNGLPYHHWTVEGPAVEQRFPREIIQDRINEKNERYEEYLNKCDECWLLIVINVFKDSQSFEMPDRIDHRFESKFERVFYMDASHRKDLRELHINRIKSFSPEEK
jgi:hypothetical protein